MFPWGDAPGHGIGRYMYEVARGLIERGDELGVDLALYQDPNVGVGPFSELPVRRFPGLRAALGYPPRGGGAEESAASAAPATGHSRATRVLNRVRDLSRARFLAGESLDLLHYGFHLGRPPAPRSLPTLITVHDLVPELYPETVGAEVLYGWRCFRRAAENATHFLAVSETVASEMERNLGISRDRVTVALHGVDRQYAPTADRGAARAMLEERYRIRAPYLLLLSTIEPRKNQVAAVRAMTRLPEEISLVLAGGKGWKTEHLPGLIDELRLNRRVHFSGFVDDPDLPALYGCAEVFVFPSHYEGFGLPVVEAMACGTPVVCSRSGALPEVAGDAATLVDADDWRALAAAIQKLLDSGSRRAAAREKGIERARLFTWERTVERTVEAYRRALDQSR